MKWWRLVIKKIIVLGWTRYLFKFGKWLNNKNRWNLGALIVFLLCNASVTKHATMETENTIFSFWVCQPAVHFKILYAKLSSRAVNGHINISSWFMTSLQNFQIVELTHNSLWCIPMSGFGSTIGNCSLELVTLSTSGCSSFGEFGTYTIESDKQGFLGFKKLANEEILSEKEQLGLLAVSENFHMNFNWNIHRFHTDILSISW